MKPVGTVGTFCNKFLINKFSNFGWRLNKQTGQNSLINLITQQKKIIFDSGYTKNTSFLNTHDTKYFRLDYKFKLQQSNLNNFNKFIKFTSLNNNFVKTTRVKNFKSNGFF